MQRAPKSLLAQSVKPFFVEGFAGMGYAPVSSLFSDHGTAWIWGGSSASGLGAMGVVEAPAAFSI